MRRRSLWLCCLLALAACGARANTWTREVGLRTIEMPEAPVVAITARIEVPFHYQVVEGPAGPDVDPALIDDVVTSQSVDSAGNTHLRYTVFFSEPVPMPAYVTKFAVKAADSDVLPVPFRLRHFAVMCEDGKASRTVVPDLIIQSHPLGQYRELP